jgi:hypothetical protein
LSQFVCTFFLDNKIDLNYDSATDSQGMLVQVNNLTSNLPEGSMEKLYSGGASRNGPREILASQLEPILVFVFRIKEPRNPSDQFSNIPLFQDSNIPTFHYSMFCLRLCRSVSPVVSESAKWKNNGKKGKTSSTFSLAGKNS